MTRLRHFLIVLATLVLVSASVRAEAPDYPKLTAGNHPRLFLDNQEFEAMKSLIGSGTSAYLSDLHNIIMEICRRDAMKDTPLEYKLDASDKRLLHVSRDALTRIFFCAYAYRYTGERIYLEYAEKAIRTVCRFKDWNAGKHFLDTGEMAAAVAIGYDWLYDALGEDTKRMAEKAFVDYAVNPARKKKGGAKFYRMTNNWNQVCNAGIVCGCLAMYETFPERARELIEISVESNRKAMNKMYPPDGNYPEGPGYWGYGSTFEVLMLSALESCVDTDFGLSETKGFSDTGRYVLYSYGATGKFYNYSDCGEYGAPSIALWYFADRFHSPDVLYNEIRLMRQGRYLNLGQESRLLPLMTAFAKNIPQDGIRAPKGVYSGNGITPVAMFHTDWTFSESDVYLGVKGGGAGAQHSHMDAGSFVFDAEGVRWAKELPNPSYTSLEGPMIKLGGSLWRMEQNSLRWRAFAYNNRQHSTLTVNDKDHISGGFTRITKVIEKRGKSGAVIDLTPALAGELSKATRTVEVVKSKDLVVTDKVKALDGKPAAVRWTLVTNGAPEMTGDGIRLTIGDKVRFLRSDAKGARIEYKVWSADPKDYDSPLKEYERPVPGTYIVGFTATVPSGGRALFRTVLGTE